MWSDEYPVSNNNPAGRLFNFLNEAYSHKGNDAVETIIAKVLHVDQRDKGELYGAVSDMITQIKKAKKAVSNVVGLNQSLLIEPLETIENMFMKINLSQHWDDFKGPLDQSTMTALRICADVLSNQADEGIIEEGDLKQLQEDVKSLLDKIVEVNFPPDIKEFLVDKLMAIYRAILGYKIKGAEGVREALESAFGALLVHQSKLKDAVQSEEQKKTLREYFNKLTELSVLVELANNTRELIGPYLPTLLGPGGP